MVDLTAEQRRQRQRETLSAPKRRYGVDARIIFWLEDRAWGPERTLPKFAARELVARSPYRAWRDMHEDQETAEGEDANERAHRDIVRQLIAEDGVPENRIRFRLVPALGALAMYVFSRLQHRVAPVRNHRLNADIEDHAEREYAELVAEHPEWERQGYVPVAVPAYGAYASRADVLRQIGADEHVHKQLSLARARDHEGSARGGDGDLADADAAVVGRPMPVAERP